MQGSANRIAVRILGQPVDIEAINLVTINQSKTMGNKHHTPSDLIGHLQFTHFTARLGGYPHRLTVIQTQGFGIRRVDGYRASMY